MFGYFAAKRDAEEVVEQSGLGRTILRVSQFHDLAWMTVAALDRFPVIPVPLGVRFQPVDTTEVAARLVALTTGPPAGLVYDLAGPEVRSLADLVRSYLRVAGRRRLLVPVPVGGGTARAIKAGANLSPDHADGRRTWLQYLAERTGVEDAVTGATTARPGPA